MVRLFGGVMGGGALIEAGPVLESGMGFKRMSGAGCVSDLNVDDGAPLPLGLVPPAGEPRLGPDAGGASDVPEPGAKGPE